MDVEPHLQVEFLRERVDALEMILGEILPMLIQDAPYERDVHQTLSEWFAEPPTRMRDNEAFVIFVQQLLDGLPDPDR
jgi:hypothetical protein